MRRVVSLALTLLLVGCPAPIFRIRVEVTVPSEVQAAFSSTSPGMVMVGTSPLAELCDPTGATFTVVYSRSVSSRPCPELFGPNATAVSVVALSQSDIDWFTASEPTVLCGQTRAIDEQTTIAAVAKRAYAANWQDASRTIAAGSGGSCDAEGNYTGTVLLQLVK